MAQLLHGDCLDVMKELEDKSVDFIFCDLPYAIDKYSAVSCKWNTPIDLEKFWIEIMRIKKLNTPIFMTTTTKFGVSLINSAPKKCPFRYDLIWVKSSPAGFLCAKKMPMRKHEMVYVFYEKLPFYDLSSHKHKFIKENKEEKQEITYGEEKQFDNLSVYGETKLPSYLFGKDGKRIDAGSSSYDPPLPVSVVKEPVVKEECTIVKRTDEGCNGLYGKEENKVFIYDEKGKLRNSEPRYDPPLPTTMLEIKSTRGKHSTEKPVALMEWLLKYFSKEGDIVLDPTMGSGSTGVACKNMNRNFIGIEMDDEIYEVACERVWS